ncbi:MAG TPA: FixH family protein [Polyangiaceae bacterium]
MCRDARGHAAKGLLAAAIALLACIACSSPNPGAGAGDGGAFPADPYTTVVSTSGQLTVAVRTSPQPPEVGTNDVQLAITQTSDGSSVDGLTLTVAPIMPSMGHGTSATTVTDQGGGIYLVSSVYLPMQGTWTLRTTISAPISDDAAPQLEIQ